LRTPHGLPTLAQALEEAPDPIAPPQFLSLEKPRVWLQLGIVGEDRNECLHIAAIPEVYRTAHNLDVLSRHSSARLAPIDN
jgi:hypothetical protein